MLSSNLESSCLCHLNAGVLRECHHAQPLLCLCRLFPLLTSGVPSTPSLPSGSPFSLLLTYFPDSQHLLCWLMNPKSMSPVAWLYLQLCLHICPLESLLDAFCSDRHSLPFPPCHSNHNKAI